MDLLEELFTFLPSPEFLRVPYPLPSPSSLDKGALPAATLTCCFPSSELSCGRPWGLAEAKPAASEALPLHLDAASLWEDTVGCSRLSCHES